MALALRRRFTVTEFHRLGEAGILDADERVELIDGGIVELSPIRSRHAACVGRLNQLLVGQAGGRIIVRVQDPVLLDERTEPQPDLALVRARPDFYAARHPGPAEILLLVEVSDATTDYDRGVKVPAYARAGIPETWLVDLGAEAVEVYRTPSPRGYTETQSLRRGDFLPVPGLDITLAIDRILG